MYVEKQMFPELFLSFLLNFEKNQKGGVHDEQAMNYFMQLML